MNGEIITNLFIPNTITNINDKFDITHGIFYSFFNLVTSTRTQLKKVINSLTSIEAKLKFTRIIIIITSLAGLLVKILLVNPIIIGENRIFLESRKYRKTRVNRIVFAFTKKRYFKTVKAMLRKNIYKLLWDFTIIGGLIKGYSYKMVPFIVAENPEINGKDAINISKQMMNGNKWNAFILDLSFIGWALLSIITLGIVGVFWYFPYK